MANTLNAFHCGAVGFIDWLDSLSGLIKVELVVEAGQIRAELLDNAFRDWRKLCSGERSAARVFCPSIMGVRDNLHVVGMALSVDLECTFHGHAMNSFRTVLTPSSEPTGRASCQLVPANHASGAKT